MNKRLFYFLLTEAAFMLILVGSIILKYEMLTQSLLIITPTILIGFAAYHHFYNGEKATHKILLTIMLYTIIALNFFGILDSNLQWKGILTSPEWINNGPLFNERGVEIHGAGDEGVTAGIYFISLINTFALISLYELVLLLKYFVNKK